MIRFVFPPYAQIWRSICTSESLRASTRVSSGFALFRHSSPSFGSQHVCSASDASQKVSSGRRCLPKGVPSHHFHYAPGFSTQTLADMLDSLARFSRRVVLNHYASTSTTKVCCTTPYHSPHTSKSYNTPKGATFSHPFSGKQHGRWPVCKEMHQTEVRLSPSKRD